MARRLFLHVGTLKSATTYLQAICDANVSALADRGLLWLGAVANFSAVADLYATTRPDEYGAGSMTWPQFAERIDEHDGDVLVSNELLSLRPPKKIGQLFRSLPPADAQVVITARDLARVTVSQWQERARYRATGTWAEFMDRLTADGSRSDPETLWFWRRQDLPTLVSSWGAKAGIDRVTVVTVPPAGSPFGVVGERFFTALAQPGLSDLTVPPATHNQSLGVHSLELIRRIHERLDADDRERLHLVNKYIVTRRVLAERAGSEPRLALTSEQLDWAREQARQMSDALVASGVRVIGDLEDLIPREADPPVVPSTPDVSDAELLDAALDVLIGLAQATDDLARGLGRDQYGDAVRAIGGQGRGQP
jgi:hypothetical protein